MTWDEYYEKFYDWSTSTQIRRLSALTSYGSPAEVTEVAMELCDEKAASRLINRALDAGVTFQVENIEDLNCCVDTATMKRVVSSVQGTLSDEALDTLTGCMDDEVFQTLLKKATSDQYAPATIMELVDCADEETFKTMVMKVTGCFDAEQLDILRDYLDQATIETLIEKSLQGKVRFAPQQIMEWLDFGISESLIEKMSLTAQGTFDANQAEELYDVLPDDTYLKIAKKHHLELHNEPIYEDISYQESAAPRLGFWGTLFAAIAGINAVSRHSERHQHNGHCNGDCANCPPHYGYRYGRWYYGHGHQYGCEFGGNKGDGSMD